MLKPIVFPSLIPVLPGLEASAFPRSSSEAVQSVDHYSPPIGEFGMLSTGLELDPTGVEQLRCFSRGLPAHKEHLADLILDLKPGLTENAFPGFYVLHQLSIHLLKQIRARKLDFVNEKIDGSPALRFGFDQQGRPFVTLKSDLERKSGARLVRTPQEADELFENPELALILKESITVLSEAMPAYGNSSLLFQGDLLYTQSNGARKKRKGGFDITANPTGLTYKVEKTDPLYDQVRRSQMGIVIHSASMMSFDDQGHPVVGDPVFGRDVIEEFAAKIKNDDLLALTPWRHDLAVAQNLSDQELDQLIEQAVDYLQSIHKELQKITPEFREEWCRYLAQFVVFLNSRLKEGKDGGLFRGAQADEAFKFELLAEHFGGWLQRRSRQVNISPSGAKSNKTSQKLAADYAVLLKDQPDQLYGVMHAYFLAVKLHYLLQSALQEAFASKLGGGEIEGLIVRDEQLGVDVKFVDRMEFTRRNFAGESKRRIPIRGESRRHLRVDDLRLAEKGDLLFDGAIVYMCKLQPFHAGHVALCAQAVADYGAQNLVIVASHKEAQLEASALGKTKLADRVSDIVERQWQYPFSLDLRRELISHGIPEGARLFMEGTDVFFGALKRIKDEGAKIRVRLLVGAKELEQGRYDVLLREYSDHVNLLSYDLFEEGLSATQVRFHVRRLSEEGDMESLEFLLKALDYIPHKKERMRLIGQMIFEWREAENAVRQILFRQ